LISAAIYFYSLALLMMPVARYSERLAARGLTWTQMLVRQAVVAVVVIATWTGINVGYLRLALGPLFWPIVLEDKWMFQLLSGIATYGTALGFTLSWQSVHRERERQRREADLVILARDAELTAIKAQMQPHFMLNALTSLLVLIDKDPAMA